MTHYFMGYVHERTQKPGDDLISYLVNAQAQRPAADARERDRLAAPAADRRHRHHLERHRLVHLASGEHPEDRRRLVAEPALMPTAIEEFLRAYAPVTMAREVVKETEIDGCTFKPGQMVLLSFPAANRDPAMFPDADKVVIDRKENRHAAFGLGIHRCVGSNLARLEMTVAVEELLKRIPAVQPRRRGRPGRRAPCAGRASCRSSSDQQAGRGRT